MPDSNSPMLTFLTMLGPLRVVLLFATVLLVCAAPFALGETYYEDWRILPTAVAPVGAVMLMFLLPLDMLMCWVFGRGDPARKPRLRIVVRTEAAMLAALVLAWSVFIYTLFPD